VYGETTVERYCGPVNLTRLLGPESRVLDVGVRDPGTALELAASGVRRYLGLAAADESLGPLPAGLAARFQPWTSAQQIFASSSDLLILRGSAQRAVWGIRALRRPRHLALERSSVGSALQVRGALALSRSTGRVRSLGIHRCGGRDFDVFELAATDPAPRPRLYLSPVLGVSGLIDRLAEEQISYVVLRWFEQLPELEPGEDLDVLVADADLQRMRALLAEEPGTIPVDLYSETGLPGSDFHSAAYYPPALARRLLETAVTHHSGCRVPAPAEHLNSLAYHAVYHKGFRSGLRSEQNGASTPDPRPEHDYRTVLAELARAQGIPLVDTLEGVDDFLASRGWRPPPDTLRRLATTNDWIRRSLAGIERDEPELPELAVFLIRERTLDVVGLADALGVLTDLGFEILHAAELDVDAQQRCHDQARGGNWGQGPFPVSGGGPRFLVAVVHYGPRRPPRSVLERYPRLTNGDVLLAKNRIRDLVAARLAPAQRFNPVHSSDDEAEAWEYLELGCPEQTAPLRSVVAGLRESFSTPLPVLRVLSLGRRAKVELVQGKQGLEVRKTFAAGSLRFLHRELAAIRELGSELSCVPELIDSGANWFSTPYYDDLLRPIWESERKLIPLPVLSRMVEALRQIHALGADLIDAKPENFLLDPAHGLKLVDYEFFHHYRADRPPFERSYAFTGVPADFDGDLPFGALGYEARWRPRTGLPLDVLLHGSVSSQRAWRAAHLLHRDLTGSDGRVRRAAREGKGQLQRGRRALGQRYRDWAHQRAFGDQDRP
jgi:hypothetical protein